MSPSQSTVQRKESSAITAECRQAMLSYANGLSLIQDAAGSLIYIEDALSRIRVLASLGAAETLATGGTRYFEQAREETGELIYGALRASPISTGARSAEEAWKTIAVAEAQAGNIESAKSLLERIEAEPAVAQAVAEVALVLVRNGRTKDALAVCAKAKDQALLLRSLEAVALSQVASGQAGVARVILCLSGDSCGLPEAKARLRAAEDRARASCLSTVEELQDQVLGIRALYSRDRIFGTAMAYAEERLYDLAETAVLRFGFSLNCSVAMAAIGRHEALNGVDPTEAFRWARAIAGIRDDQLCQSARSVLGYGSIAIGDWVRDWDEAMKLWRKGWTDSAVVKIAAIEGTTASDLCIPARKFLDKLTEEERLDIPLLALSDAAAIQAAGAILDEPEHRCAIARVPLEKQDLVREHLEVGLYLRKGRDPIKVGSGDILCENTIRETARLSSADRVEFALRNLADERILLALGACLSDYQAVAIIRATKAEPLTRDEEERLRSAIWGWVPMPSPEDLKACPTLDPFSETRMKGNESDSDLRLTQRERVETLLECGKRISRENTRRASRERAYRFVPTGERRSFVKVRRILGEANRQIRTGSAAIRLTAYGPAKVKIYIRGRAHHGSALARQKRICTDSLPFTLNTATGCLFGCRYCYLQASVFSEKSDFGREMIIKEEIVPKLRLELGNYRGLPQNLKRVQLGNTTEVYHPYVLKAYKSHEWSGPVVNCLRAFLDEQDKKGSVWAIHLSTKSPLILHDLDIIRRLACFQAEITIPTVSEDRKRTWEGSAPSVAKRFELVKKLTDAGVFVRVLAMPVFLEPSADREIRQRLAQADPDAVEDAIAKAWKADVDAIWQRARGCGAVALKARGLKFFEAKELAENGKPLPTVKVRNRAKKNQVLIHSGEIVRGTDGSMRTVRVRTWSGSSGTWRVRGRKPKHVKSSLSLRDQEMPLMDYGYQLMDHAKRLDWGDCVWAGTQNAQNAAASATVGAGEQPVNPSVVVSKCDKTPLADRCVGEAARACRERPERVADKRKDVSGEKRGRRMTKVLLRAKGAAGRYLRILGKPSESAVLAKQKKINTYNFPFTLNTTTGCLFGCRYCYIQAGFFASHSEFGGEMILKQRIIPKLKKELQRYRTLPQHLRRVQIGPATEVYHPYVQKVSKGDPDSPLMSNVLRTFLVEQEAGYPWAVHVVTKSPLIEGDVEILKRLVCFQAEITITTISEEGKRQWEGSSPSVARRFETIKRLSDQGIFVRVMAMPLFPKPEEVAAIRRRMNGAAPEDITDEIEKARWADGEAIWLEAKARGAVAFKAKGLNYFDAEQLTEKGEPAKKVKGRNEDPNKEMLIHSGEILRNPDGSEGRVEVQTWWYEAGEREKADGSKKRFKKMFHQGICSMPLMDFGYSMIEGARKLDWGDCR